MNGAFLIDGERFFIYIKLNMLRGDLSGLRLARVEKVKPDPLNLLVNTDVGKQINIVMMKMFAEPSRHLFYYSER